MLITDLPAFFVRPFSKSNFTDRFPCHYAAAVFVDARPVTS